MYASTGLFLFGLSGGAEELYSLNGDGVVNVSGLLTLLSAWGSCPR